MGDVRIVIVDDSEVYLSTQELVLGLQEGIAVVATVQDRDRRGVASASSATPTSP